MRIAYLLLALALSLSAPAHAETIKFNPFTGKPDYVGLSENGDGSQLTGVLKPGDAPTAHAASHGSAGSDPVTPGSIGAATAAQGAKADLTTYTVSCAGTDDTAAIQAALDNASYRTVELPDKTCKITSTLTITRSNLTVRGRGQDSTTIYRTANFGDSLLIAPTDPVNNMIYGVRVQGLKFFQATNPMTTGAHVHFKSVGNATIDDVATSGGFGGILAEKVNKLDVKHWRSQSGSLYTTSDATYGFMARQGVYAADPRNFMITLDDWFINFDANNKYIKNGIAIYDNDTLKITTGHVQGYYGSGILLAPPTGSYLVQAVLENNYIDSGAPDATSQGIVVADTGGTLGDITISNSPMNGESTVNTYGGKNGIYVNSPRLNGLKIFGNTILDWEEDGINIVSGRNIAIQGNNVSANNQSNTGKDGIRVAASLSEIVVENNQIGVRTIFDIPNTQAVGLEVGSGCTGSFAPNVYGTRNTTNYSIASTYNSTAQTGVSAGSNIAISGAGVISSSAPSSFANTAITTDQITAGIVSLTSAGFTAAGGATVTGTSPDVTMAVSASFVAYGPTVDTAIDVISYTTTIAGPILVIRNSGSANAIFKHNSSKLRMIGGKDRTLPPLHSIMFVKLTTASIWQEIGLPDADTLDGQHGNYYAPANAPTITGHPTIEGVTSAGATGTGKLVFDTSPTLVTPSLGVASATSINGTTIPTSATLVTTASGLATDSNKLNGQLASYYAPVNSPSLVTPALGVATATSINKVAITQPATSATLTVANGKTLTASNSITLSGTDGSTLDIGNGGALGSGAFKATTTTSAGAADSGKMPLLDSSGKLDSSVVPAATTTSGTYTPTMYANNNLLAAPTASSAIWSRIGDVVTVTGSFSATANAYNAYTEFGISLPVTSAFTSTADAGGTGAVLYGPALGITASPADPRVLVKFNYSPYAGYSMNGTYTFSYVVK